jgi:hypothetical protein
VEPKGEGVQGKTGFSISGNDAAPKTVEPKTFEKAPKTPEKKDNGSTNVDANSTKSSRINAPLPAVRPMRADLLAQAASVLVP